MQYRRFLLAAALLLSLAAPGCKTRPDSGGGTGGGTASAIEGLSLAEARKKHPTALKREGPAPQGYDNRVPPDAKKVTYGRAGLVAWLARPAGSGPHAAVLWGHQGFALLDGDFESAVRPFLDAGFVVMAPAWRGENGNPGRFELYYGEVDDAVEALDYLAELPGVDPKRLYMAGHSTGGTLALLTAEVSPKLRAAAACGAMVDVTGFIDRHGIEQLPDAPYLLTDLTESNLRSSARYLQDLKCPVALYYGEEEKELLELARPMVEKAASLGKTVTLDEIRSADHFSALGSAVRRMIQFFRK